MSSQSLLDTTYWIDVCQKDGNLLATGGGGKKVKIFDKRHGEIIQTFDKIHQGKQVCSAVFKNGGGIGWLNHFLFNFGFGICFFILLFRWYLLCEMEPRRQRACQRFFWQNYKTLGLQDRQVHSVRHIKLR